MSINSKKCILIYGALGLLFFTIGFLLCLTLVGMIVGFPMIGVGLGFFTMVDRIKKTEAKK
jgi:hypothetical protein